MKQLLLLLGALSCIALAQPSSQQIQYTTSTPSGSCSNTAIRLLTPNGTLYTCQAGMWGAVGGGTATGFTTATIATLPATCSVGAARYVTDATVSVGGFSIYLCTATNTWTQWSVTAGGTGAITVTCATANSCIYDINTAYVPNLGGSNSWATGSQTFASLGTDTNDCAFQNMTAAGTITQYQAVQVGGSGVSNATTGGAPVIGIAQAAATVGNPVAVCFSGTTNVKVDGTVVAGDLIVVSTSTAGQGHTAGAVLPTTIATTLGVIGTVVTGGNCTGAGCTAKVVLVGVNAPGLLPASLVGLTDNGAGSYSLTRNLNGGDSVYSAGFTTYQGASFVNSGATKYSISGCSTTSPHGGPMAGDFLSGTTGTCTVTITQGSGLNPGGGWVCIGYNQTTGVAVTQTANTTTTATLTVATTSGNKVVFWCGGYNNN